MEKILAQLELMNKRISYLAEAIENVEQKCTSVQAYVRRNLKQTKEAMEVCHKAFKLCANAQYNLSEDLSTYAGTTMSLDDACRIKIV